VTARKSWWALLGPGLIWAGTAVGVSHLVQSTRAGAGFGLALVWVVVVANVVKYPAFEAGPRYATATGSSLLMGYRRRGLWMVAIFLAVTLSTMFTVVAAVTIVAAGMTAALAPVTLPVSVWAAGLLALSIAMLAIGRFRLLEAFMKIMMVILAVATVLAVAVSLPSVDWSAVGATPWVPTADTATLAFVVALVGWMPSAIDISVWQSLWCLERARGAGEALDVQEVRFDFNVGYIGTALLALCFVFLGAAMLFGSSEELPKSAGAFAVTLIDVFTASLGNWARPILLIAAFATMLSTTVAVVDGFPRAIEGAVQSVRHDGQPTERTWVYWTALGGITFGALLIIVQFTGHLLALVDLATTLTGLTAPVLAAMNLAALRGAEVPEAFRPRGAYLMAHVAAIVVLASLAALYVWVRFFAG
jgi:Mn2+/Fe2+ NRAMP family transporter